MRKGYGPILERYKTAYSTPDQMGKLTYSDLEVRLLKGSSGKAEFAVVTGPISPRSHRQRRSQKG